MQNLNNLLNVCNNYISGDFNIEEFQSRIITSAVPENLSEGFVKSLVDFDNKLEEIIFCSAYESREEEGHVVANELIEAIKEERDHYEK